MLSASLVVLLSHQIAKAVEKWRLPPSDQRLKGLNEHERALLEHVIEPDSLHVGFDDVGGLEDVKQELLDLIILPFKRPELFAKSSLLGTPKGILVSQY